MDRRNKFKSSPYTRTKQILRPCTLKNEFSLDNNSIKEWNNGFKYFPLICANTTDDVNLHKSDGNLY